MRAESATVLGLTFKENVVDIRNSQTINMIRELQSFGLAVQVHDPLADPATAMHEYGLSLCSENELVPADAVVLAVSHDCYRDAGWSLISRLLKSGRGLVIDIKGTLDPEQRPRQLELWRLPMIVPRCC
jgi:UDP-N-acetyl-D-glucosamine/UDP-N-acetyl-D-galactosamine dehydrogenase